MENRTTMYLVGCALGTAIVLFLFGVLFLLGNQGKPGYIVAGIAMVGLGIAVGAFGLRSIGRFATCAPEATEQRIRNLAALSGGEVTASQVHDMLQIPLAEAQAALERLVSKGIAQHKMRDDELYYTFPTPK